MPLRNQLLHIVPAIALQCVICATHAAELALRFVNGADKPLVDAVVFAQLSGSAPRASAPKPSAIVQRARVFEPFVTVVEKDTAISFPNEDSMAHHVYSFSPAKRFELKLYKGSAHEPVVFNVPGVIALGCNVHDWMLAYIVVVDTPFFAKTDQNGEARLTHLPAGNLDLMVWYPGMKAPVRAQAVTLSKAESQSIEHRLDVTLRTRPRAPPYNPMQY